MRPSVLAQFASQQIHLEHAEAQQFACCWIRSCGWRSHNFAPSLHRKSQCGSYGRRSAESRKDDLNSAQLFHRLHLPTELQSFRGSACSKQARSSQARSNEACCRSRTNDKHRHHHAAYAAEASGLLVIAVLLLILVLIRYWPYIRWSAPLTLPSSPDREPLLVVVIGPTASGKTALALALARKVRRRDRELRFGRDVS